MFKILTTKYFDKKFGKLVKNNTKLRDKVIKTIKLLAKDPQSLELKSHKVENVWSSRVNGDIRIIWIYSDNQIKVLELLDIGGHSGGNAVYK